MSELEDRVVVITGSGRGIGAATARLMSREGARVVVNDIGVALDGSGGSTGPAAELVAEITADGGVAVADTNDISDFDGAGRLVQRAIDEFGRLDVLVNVAGILRDKMLFNMAPEEWEAVLKVHMTGTFNTSAHASRHWRERKDPGANARLINFTSDSGLYGAPGQPNYAAAKMGIVGFTYSCANALGRYGVTANAVAPGAATRMFDSIPDEETKARLAREMTPEHVARVVTYLASAKSGWLTGQVIGAQRNRVSLFSKPVEQVRLVSPVDWDLEMLDLEMRRGFLPVVDPNGEVSTS